MTCISILQVRAWPWIFFFARHDIQETLKARTVIGSLVQQLLDLVTDFTQVSEAFETTSKKEPLERMLHLLKSVLQPDFKAFVVDIRRFVSLTSAIQFIYALLYPQPPSSVYGMSHPESDHPAIDRLRIPHMLTKICAQFA